MDSAEALKDFVEKLERVSEPGVVRAHTAEAREVIISQLTKRDFVVSTDPYSAAEQLELGESVVLEGEESEVRPFLLEIIDRDGAVTVRSSRGELKSFYLKPVVATLVVLVKELTSGFSESLASRASLVLEVK